MRCEEAQSAGDIRSLGSADPTRHPLLWERRGWEAAALSQGLGDLGTPGPFCVPPDLHISSRRGLLHLG
ncbi:hypothetical protein DC434_15720 [Microbacterium sp. TPD7012]|nr:hypothetical protein DC434_15720 [Microbacterium sp. TPD7012]